MKKILITSLSLLVAFSLVPLVSAQSGRIMGNEMSFLEQAAKNNLYEIRAAELAADKASDPQVKEYAQNLVQDHSKVRDQLQQLAAEQDINVPNDLDIAHQENIDSLYNLSGSEFDKTYMEQTVESHQSDVAAFKKIANEADDRQIANFAASTVPHLEDHLAKAREISNQLQTEAK